ncbi:PREDICTED: uncharacterized protein LOC105564556 [Vollenhovia emeryi]|uniref:uncharacterized protein LOC105564556 n=1 Tax=Vollenhovia emeryi TaxID=411798 RepID=UPI0005F50BD6|nr:PREDICTED: uncharacterized protein LOC105564556 [Vollenhovia emeryi]
MKFALALLALVATSFAAPWQIPNVGRGELAKELQDFLNILPQEQIAAITLQYYAQDAEFQAMIQYFKSDGFKQLVKEIQALPEMQALMQYMYNAGIDVYKLQDMLNNWLGLTQVNFAIDTQITGGIRGYIDDIKAVISPVKDKLIALYHEKMQSSTVFQDFVNQLKSPNFQQLVNKVHANPKFQELLKHAANAKIDLKLVRDILKTILGIDIPSYYIYHQSLMWIKSFDLSQHRVEFSCKHESKSVYYFFIIGCILDHYLNNLIHRKEFHKVLEFFVQRTLLEYVNRNVVRYSDAEDYKQEIRCDLRVHSAAFKSIQDDLNGFDIVDFVYGLLEVVGLELTDEATKRSNYSYSCQSICSCHASTATTMKLTLGLCAVLAIIGQGQAHQFPEFGHGPLYEDFQDILDLVPIENILEVAVDYVIHDNEVQDFLEELGNTTVIKDLLVDFQAIPEVINLFNYLHKEGIYVYHIMNAINKALDIKELVPPSSQVSPLKRTGGVRGFFIDIKKHLDYDVFISIYVDKLKVSTVFVNFINQLKSDNFQQIVNKMCESKAAKYIISSLEAKSVNLKIVRDILYVVFGINVPSGPPKTLMDDFIDFAMLIPMENYTDIVIKYVNEDEKVQKAFMYMFETEFHDLLRNLEAAKEFQAFVIHLEKAGIPVIEMIQALHQAIGMEKYVPPKVDSFIKSLIKPQKIGDGMKGMLKDLYDILPLNEIDALYKQKMRTSKAFVEFIRNITSDEMGQIYIDLVWSKPYKNFITKTLGKGLEIEGSVALSVRMIGLK